MGFVDASNLEREKWNLAADMAEVFFTEKLRQYPFPVWEGENFTPEAVVWDQMAVDGYRLRWFNRVIYYCDYQPDGLTASTWKLLKHNPMGYALLFNVKLLYTKRWKAIVYWVLQFCSCCCLAKEYTYILKCHHSVLAVLLSPLGWLLSRRRRKQINQYA